MSDILLLHRIIKGPLTEEEIKTLNVTEKENSQSHYYEDLSWEKTAKVTFDSDVKIYVLKNQPRGKLFPSRPPQRDQLLAKQHVKEVFERNGNTVVEIEVEEFNSAFNFWTAMLAKADPSDFAESLSAGRTKMNVVWEVFIHIFSLGYLSNFPFPLLMFAAVDRFEKKNPKMLEKQVEMFHSFKTKMYKLLNTPLEGQPRDEKVLLLCPSLPFVAPKHGPFPHVLFSAEVAATCVFNVLELPATAVPTGLASKRMPTGVQM